MRVPSPRPPRLNSGARPSFPLTPSVSSLRGRERETRGCVRCCAQHGVGEGTRAGNPGQRSLESALVLALEIARKDARSWSLFSGVFAGALEGHLAARKGHPAIDCGEPILRSRPGAAAEAGRRGSWASRCALGKWRLTTTSSPGHAGAGEFPLRLDVCGHEPLRGSSDRARGL